MSYIGVAVGLVAAALGLLLVVACGQTKPDTNTNATARGEQPEVTKAGTELLASIADWHLRWDNSPLFLDVHEDMVAELKDLVESRIDLLPEPLVRQTTLYLSAHEVETMMDFDAGVRRANFIFDSGFDAGLVREMVSSSECDVPLKDAAPEALQQEWELIVFQCQALDFYRESVLDSYRKLSEETWLKPYLGAR